jgi:hypothetical protein
MYAVYIFNSKGQAVAAETICALAFLIIPNFIAALLAIFALEEADAFSPLVRFVLMMKGLYPLVNMMFHIRNSTIYCSFFLFYIVRFSKNCEGF